MVKSLEHVTSSDLQIYAETVRLVVGKVPETKC